MVMAKQRPGNLAGRADITGPDVKEAGVFVLGRRGHKQVDRAQGQYQPCEQANAFVTEWSYLPDEEDSEEPSGSNRTPFAPQL
jgi:hypothetical protein